MFAYLLACVLGIFLVVVYLYATRRNGPQKSLSPLVRCVSFFVFIVFGVGILWHLYGALDDGLIHCGRAGRRRICSQEDDGLGFSLAWIFYFVGGVCLVAGSIFVISRPNPEDEV